MKSFRELRVWQQSIDLVETVYFVDSEISESGTLWFNPTNPQSNRLCAIEHRRGQYARPYKRVSSSFINGSSFIGRSGNAA